MVVAVVAVRMVQASIDEVVGVVAVRDWVMSTARPVNMTAVVTRGGVGVICGVIGVNGENMLIDVALVRVVQMAVVEVVDVPVVLNGGVPAVWSVDVGVIGVDVMLGHRPTVGLRC